MIVSSTVVTRREPAASHDIAAGGGHFGIAKVTRSNAKITVWYRLQLACMEWLLFATGRGRLYKRDALSDLSRQILISSVMIGLRSLMIKVINAYVLTQCSLYTLYTCCAHVYSLLQSMNVHCTVESYPD